MALIQCGECERDGDVAYFTDREGVRFRVYDCVFGKPIPGMRRIVPLESPKANTRYFVREHGETRAYTFTRAEPRALSPERLEQQLNGAGFVAGTPRDFGALRPT